ncbi:ATP-binding protein [Rhodocaloribacter litoris]|uniref:hypothetical protein n=1 Tax=Rhodocaloribacter litoris TaxID=2558931 RepID=UPI00141EDB5F|nr:hypothetical protein [Rhodocaloribacter litoris]QXD15924.1 ATP-binding protein [Rhodocaloribacter litoris]GIV60176.1 MAG: hypothetical protein KatS3mg043_1265 [Rhodothermaceae bacterium]
MATQRINPLSRRPRKRRLVMAVRGAAGTGKSVFAATLADAGLGRLCFFDTERKARLLPGSDGTKFDAIEVEHPDELPAFIDWALEGEGRAQGYGCYALDSWAMYFARKHRETLQAVRRRTGDPLAQPPAEALAADQMILQEVLRRLCIDSGACVVITDQIPARGKEEREENELGRVLPMTASGLEYFVDVMVELDVRLEGFEQVRVARVVKSNSPAFPIGLEVRNPTFADFLARLGEGPQPEDADPVPEVIEVPEPEVPAGPTLEVLLERAAAFGLSRADLLIAARHYCGATELERLTSAQIDDLLQRMQARYGNAGDGAPATASTPVPAGGPGRRRNGKQG